MNKELDLTKLDELSKEDLMWWVKTLAGKLEKRTHELEGAKAKMNGRIGATGKKNPNVK